MPIYGYAFGCPTHTCRFPHTPFACTRYGLHALPTRSPRFLGLRFVGCLHLYTRLYILYTPFGFWFTHTLYLCGLVGWLFGSAVVHTFGFGYTLCPTLYVARSPFAVTLPGYIHVGWLRIYVTFGRLGWLPHTRYVAVTPLPLRVGYVWCRICPGCALFTPQLPHTDYPLIAHVAPHTDYLVTHTFGSGFYLCLPLGHPSCPTGSHPSPPAPCLGSFGFPHPLLHSLPHYLALPVGYLLDALRYVVRFTFGSHIAHAHVTFDLDYTYPLPLPSSWIGPRSLADLVEFVVVDLLLLI